jgi:hypothetical protein
MNVPRRRWQFSLRTLLMLMLIVAAFCGGWASRQGEVMRARRQAEQSRAALEIERALLWLAKNQPPAGRTEIDKSFPETEHGPASGPSQQLPPQTSGE